jgi:hypothetical protein
MSRDLMYHEVRVSKTEDALNANLLG